MRIRRVSCLPLMMSLLIGLFAVWAAGAPALDSGNSVLGGWLEKYDMIAGRWYGCTTQDCLNCSGVQWATCGYDQDQQCTLGASILIAITGGSGMPGASDGTPCAYANECKYVYNAKCDF